MKILGGLLLVAVVGAGIRQVALREVREAPAAPEVVAAASAPPSARRAPPKPLMSGGKAVMVAPGTGEVWLVEPARYLEMLGQGYQPATRADVDAHNAAERERTK